MPHLGSTWCVRHTGPVRVIALEAGYKRVLKRDGTEAFPGFQSNRQPFIEGEVYTHGRHTIHVIVDDEDILAGNPYLFAKDVECHLTVSPVSDFLYLLLLADRIIIGCIEVIRETMRMLGGTRFPFQGNPHRHIGIMVRIRHQTQVNGCDVIHPLVLFKIVIRLCFQIFLHIKKIKE